MKRKDKGMTLMELLVGVVVLMAIMAAIGIRVRDIMQRTRVSSAKAAISTFALALGSMRDDTGIYPLMLQDLKSSAVPSHLNIPARFWNGPYLTQRISLLDPWGNPYFYELIHGPVFGPEVFFRYHGGPYDEEFEFKASAGAGKLIIINEDSVTSANIWINGVEVVTPDEFKAIIPRIEKDLYLLDENIIRIRIASEPGRTIILTVASASSAETRYILGSHGRNGEIGGEGYDADIVYGDFR